MLRSIPGLAVGLITAASLSAQALPEANGDPLNDTAAGAEFAAVGAQLNGTAIASDNDFWAVTISNAPTRLTAWTHRRGFAGALTDTLLSIIGTDGTTVLATDDDSNEGQFSLVGADILTNGVYYLNVQPDVGFGSYAVDVNVEPILSSIPNCTVPVIFPSFTETEPTNSICQTTTDVITDCCERIENLTNNDTDFYQVTIAACEEVTFETIDDSSLTNARGDTKLWIYDSTHTLIAMDDDSGTGLLARLEVALEPGTYYLEVADWTRSAPGEYHLVVSNDVLNLCSQGPGSQSSVNIQPGAAQCLGSNAAQTLFILRQGERVERGTTVSATIIGAAGNGVSFLGFGPASLNPIPINLAIIGAPDCLLAVNPVATPGFVLDGNGEGEVSFPVGGLPVGLDIHAQAALIDIGAPRALQITTSDNRIVWTVGDDTFQ